ncbi:MAG: response regulator [Ktedonobacteraceae bacterium]
MRKIQLYPAIPASTACALDATGEAFSPGASAHTVHANTPLVMLIDDSVTVRTLVEVSLRRAGIAVVSYPDGIHGLEAVSRQIHRVPDVLILDIGLPHLDGYTIARLLKIHPSWKHTAILMLSGRTSVLDRLKGRLAGADVYLTKPFRTQDLVGVIRDCLGIPSPLGEEGGRG